MRNKESTPNKGIQSLTQREYEVLIALASGQSNKGIAKSLFISEHTVKKHVGQILEKLDLKDRTQAALFAISKGLNNGTGFEEIAAE